MKKKKKTNKRTKKNLASRSEGKRPAEKDRGGKKTPKPSEQEREKKTCEERSRGKKKPQNLASRSEGKTCGERAKGKKKK